VTSSSGSGRRLVIGRMCEICTRGDYWLIIRMLSIVFSGFTVSRRC